MQFTLLGITTRFTGLNPQGFSLEAGPKFLKHSSSTNKGFFLKLVAFDSKPDPPSIPEPIQTLINSFSSTNLVLRSPN
jgi:hypothetical protein